MNTTLVNIRCFMLIRFKNTMFVFSFYVVLFRYKIQKRSANKTEIYIWKLFYNLFDPYDFIFSLLSNGIRKYFKKSSALNFMYFDFNGLIVMLKVKQNILLVLKLDFFFKLQTIFIIEYVTLYVFHVGSYLIFCLSFMIEE